MFTFYKYHGAGNDFILIDNRKNIFTGDDLYINSLCNRHTGIGADGLILLNRSLDAQNDFAMQYFNADGLEGTMCGNGGRCIAAFAYYLQITGKKMQFHASDGQHRAEILNQKGNFSTVQLAMKNVEEIVTYPDGFYLNTGSPHFVQFIEELDAFDVRTQGKKLRYDPRFPSGTNVNFVEVGRDDIFVRTYERGVENETLSCGTGVTASALVFAFLEEVGSVVSVRTIGGRFIVSFTQTDKKISNIFLEGNVCRVYKGEME